MFWLVVRELWCLNYGVFGSGLYCGGLEDFVLEVKWFIFGFYCRIGL